MQRPLRLKGIDAGRVYSAKEVKTLKETRERDEFTSPIITKIHKKGVKADPLRGLFDATIDGKPTIVEYEPDSDLRDTEQVPLLEAGGVEAFIRREVLPYATDAWIDEAATKIGYEVSFTRYFYKPPALRTLEAIRADILALETETEGLLSEIVGEAAGAEEGGCHRGEAVGHARFVEALSRVQELRPAVAGRDPAHWDEQRAKYLYREVDERSTTAKCCARCLTKPV